MNNIKKAREAAGLSQKEVAISLHVSAPTVSEWESGKKNPSIVYLKQLADKYNVSVDYLLGRSNQTEKNTSELTDVPVISLLLDYCNRFGKDSTQVIQFYNDNPASLENLRLGNPPKAIDDLTLQPILGMSIKSACTAADIFFSEKKEPATITSDEFSTAEQSLIQLFRLLTPEQQDMVIRVVESAAESKK